MPWVVDTCVLIDILEGDPEFGVASAQCLSRHLSEGLVACPVTTIEMAPAFSGSVDGQKDFFARCGVNDTLDFSPADGRRAFTGWHQYVAAKRRKTGASVPRRPVADIMIGAFACRFEGLITRNGQHFRPWYRDLAVVDPTKFG